MEKLSCIIVDDDKVIRTILEEFVTKTNVLSLAGVFDNAIEAGNFLFKRPVDLLLLDVEMPSMTGLDLIKALKDPPQIILISNNKEYALDAFEYNVTDYILKPLDNYARFLSAIERVRNNLTANPVQSTDHYIFIKEESRLVKVDIREILYLQAYGDYIKIYMPDKVHVVLSTLKSLLDKLPASEFFQCHRSYIVHLAKIDMLEGNSLRINKQLVPISRSFKDDLLKRIKPF